MLILDVFCKCGFDLPGAFVVEVVPKWAPLGTARLKEMVTSGFFDSSVTGGVAMFRTVKGFVSQFGIHGDPKASACSTSRNHDIIPLFHLYQAPF
jgi:hypothetical protein